MNREDIIRMARVSIIGYPDCDPENIPPLEEEEFAVFECFASLVSAYEIEACAKVCDELAARDKLSNYYKVAANAIRARRNK